MDAANALFVLLYISYFDVTDITFVLITSKNKTE